MTKENRKYNSLTDGKDELFTLPEVPELDALDDMARELPPEFEGFWIADLVRAFGKSRGLGDDALADLFQEAALAAFKAVSEAEAKGGDPTAFVKAAVRFRLTDLNRRHDCFTHHIAYAEDGARKEDSDPAERLVEELPSPEYTPSRRAAVDAVRLAALIVSPASRRYWRAFRATKGSCAAIAARLKLSVRHVRLELAPLVLQEFAAAIELVHSIRGRATR